MKNLYKKIGLTMLSYCLAIAAMAQTAQVQVIHNSADAMADSVDIYLNGTLTLDNFAFRSATPFLSIPAGTPQVIGVAPKNSTGYGDTLTTFTYTLTAGAKYVIVADGLLNTTGYKPFKAFNLEVYAMGREEASTSGNTDVLVHHGSTDAPPVDVMEIGVGAGTIVNNIEYTDFQGYLELGTMDYRLAITDSTGMVKVKSYEAPLKTLGLMDSALVVVASGFLDPSMNSNGPAFGLYVALPTGGNLIPLPESMARAQVIHNSPDAAASTVDIYINGMKAVDDFGFRTSTPFIDLPAIVPVVVGIAPGNSMGYQDTLTTFTYELGANEKYVIVADGLIDATAGYTPFQPFNLEVYGMGREMASMMGNTDVLVHHGSTDAPAVDVQEVKVGAGTIVNNLEYTDFQGYLELPTADYTLMITDSTGTTTVAKYDAPLSSLMLDDEAIVVVASGFLDPSMNNNGPAFGLYVALTSGGPLVALPTSALSVEEDLLEAVVIYPNPVNDRLFIQGLDGDEWDYTVFDMVGRTIQQGQTESMINVDQLSTGSYILNIYKGDANRTFKFLK